MTNPNPIPSSVIEAARDKYRRMSQTSEDAAGTTSIATPEGMREAADLRGKARGLRWAADDLTDLLDEQRSRTYVPDTLNRSETQDDGRTYVARRVGGAAIIDPDLTLHMSASDATVLLNALTVAVEGDPETAQREGFLSLWQDLREARDTWRSQNSIT